MSLLKSGEWRYMKMKKKDQSVKWKGDQLSHFKPPKGTKKGEEAKIIAIFRVNLRTPLYFGGRSRHNNFKEI